MTAFGLRSVARICGLASVYCGIFGLFVGLPESHQSSSSTSLGVACAAQICEVSPGRVADYHVAVDGSDSNPGSVTKPFATLARARQAVRLKIAQGLKQDIVVEVHGGTYLIAETLRYGPEDSGTLESSIVYRAAPGERVVIDGGRRISSWKKGVGPVWTAFVPETMTKRRCPRQLFVDGKRAIRARTPNRGWCEGKPVQPIEHSSAVQPIEIHINTDGGKGIYGWAHEFEYEQEKIDGGIANCSSAADIELVSLRHNEGGRKRLQSINATKQTVTLRPPHLWAPKCFGNDWFNAVPDGRCYLENAGEFLDAPGEWYLDRGTNILSYWPRLGENPPDWDAVMPVVSGPLLLIEGTSHRPVINLHFRGLLLEHADYQLPPHGYAGLFCCNVPVFRETGEPGHRFIEAALEMTHARSCSFRDGGIARVGGMGIVLGEGTADITIEGNEVQQTGAGGIGLGQCNVGFGYLKAASPPARGEYEGFRVCNNYVHHCGLDYFGAVGIAIFRVKGSIISHNLIHDTAYCGVVFPGDQDPAWDFTIGNRFERNHIYRDMQVTQDGAGLYVSFAHRDTIVRANLIHDSSGRPMSGGICLDGCTGVVFDHNVVYRNPVWSLVLFRPDDLMKNAWTGNLIMPARPSGVASVNAKTLFDGRRGWEINLTKQKPSPPGEFLEVMREYAGLKPAFRRQLQGVDPRRCDLHVLNDRLTWQFNLPDDGSGIVYRIDARAGNAGDARSAAKLNCPVNLQELDKAAMYSLTAYAGEIVLSPTDSSVEDFTQGALFPMVHEVRPVHEIPASAAGSSLMNGELELPSHAGAFWIVYRKTR
jgi:hypothetical protein